MKRWHLLFISAISMISAIIIVVSNSNIDAKEKKEVEVVDFKDGTTSKDSDKPYVVSFEEVQDDKGVSSDIEILDNGYNGTYMETNGDESLINYAKPSVGLVNSASMDDVKLISMSDNDAWAYLTDGALTSYPDVPYKDIEDIIKLIYKNNSETIKVKVWTWKNSSDKSDLSKKTVTISLNVHRKLSSIFEKIFYDIYNNEYKPVINVNDTGMGTWVLRGKNHSVYNTLSAHSLGTAIDINPSTGTFSVNGTTYGNSYGSSMMPYDVWNVLPDNQTKYNVLYEDSPIVQIFKSYGFYWGGDWACGTDSMHFAFLGDSSGRKKGFENYVQYRR